MGPSTVISFETTPDLSALKAIYPGTQALFFDMDGTLFDTEKFHEQALLCIAREHKIRPPLSREQTHELMMGKADHLVFDLVKDWPGFPQNWALKDFVLAKNQYLMQILAPIPTSTYFPPPLLELLQSAKQQGLKLALVTSSEKIITHELLRLTSLAGYFELVLTRDDCPLHKPDPWPYREALNQLKLSPFEVIIFEDSQVGLQAAKATGAHVIKANWFSK